MWQPLPRVDEQPTHPWSAVSGHSLPKSLRETASGVGAVVATEGADDVSASSAVRAKGNGSWVAAFLKRPCGDRVGPSMCGHSGCCCRDARGGAARSSRPFLRHRSTARHRTKDTHVNPVTKDPPQPNTTIAAVDTSCLLLRHKLSVTHAQRQHARSSIRPPTTTGGHDLRFLALTSSTTRDRNVRHHPRPHRLVSRSSASCVVLLDT